MSGADAGRAVQARKMARVRRVAMAFWRALEGECGTAGECARALLGLADEYENLRAQARAAQARALACHVRMVQFRRMLLATATLPAAVHARAAARLARLHLQVEPSAVAAATGWAGKIALVRIRTAPEYDLPPGRFLTGPPRICEFENPPGHTALVVAPGWPLPVDLVAVRLCDGQVFRQGDGGPVIDAGGPACTDGRMDVHVHGPAWMAARAAATRAGVSADTVPPLIADARAVKWTRRGILAGVEILNVVDACPADAEDPVLTIWRMMPATLRRSVIIRTPQRGKKAEREKVVPSPRPSPVGEGEKVEAGG